MFDFRFVMIEKNRESTGDVTVIELRVKTEEAMVNYES